MSILCIYKQQPFLLNNIYVLLPAILVGKANKGCVFSVNSIIENSTVCTLKEKFCVLFDLKQGSVF